MSLKCSKDDKKRKAFDLGARKALRLPFFVLGHETPQYAAYLHAIEKGDLDFTKVSCVLPDVLSADSTSHSPAARGAAQAEK